MVMRIGPGMPIWGSEWLLPMVVCFPRRPTPASGIRTTILASRGIESGQSLRERYKGSSGPARAPVSPFQAALGPLNNAVVRRTMSHRKLRPQYPAACHPATPWSTPRGKPGGCN